MKTKPRPLLIAGHFVERVPAGMAGCSGRGPGAGATFLLAALHQVAAIVHGFGGLDDGARALGALVHEGEDLLELGAIEFGLRSASTGGHQEKDVPHVAAEAVHHVPRCDRDAASCGG